MADRSTRIAAACSVLLAGLVAALLFRHESPQAGQQIGNSDQRLVLRRQTGPLSGSRTISDPRHQPVAAAPLEASPVDPRGAILPPFDPGQPPPPLARDYPGTELTENTHWGTSIGLPPARERPTRRPGSTHKIVDGDTLQDLARRYLGTADRYLEIYEVNRDLLPSPQLLPIGAELKIPPSSGGSTFDDDYPAMRPLVPIPRVGHGNPAGGEDQP